MKSSAGFNLFEMLAVIMIVGILAAIAVPMFKYVSVSNRMSGEINGLLGDMQYARNEAVKEGQTVTICASANPTATVPRCSGSTSWQSGWIVFSDPVNNQHLPTGAPVLRSQPAFTANDTLVADNSVQAVTFNREGFANSGPLGTETVQTAVTITLHDATDNTQWTRCLAINSASLSIPSLPTSGMLVTEKVNIGNCR